MATQEQELLDRISSVYGESQKYLPFEDKTAEAFNYIAQTHSLHFNRYYPANGLAKLTKKVFQRLTSPLLRKQVEFNVTVREILLLANAAISELERSVKDLQASHAVVADLERDVRRLVARATRTEEEARIKSGLFFNDPIHVGYDADGEAYWRGTTERILEKGFVLQSLARLYPDRQVGLLDVGAAESLLSYELASLGYTVTATDIRPIGLSHPNLKFVKGDICKPVFAASSFDCVIALSTLEHIGLGWYGDDTGGSLDHAAAEQIFRLLKPGGHLLLTVPYGKAAVTPVHRIYDAVALQQLVKSFQVDHVEYGVRMDDFTFLPTQDEADAVGRGHDPENYLPGAVAMLVCSKGPAAS